MIVPIGYALGIVAMLLVRDLFLVLPGSGNPAIAAQGMLLMLLPAIVASAKNRARAPKTHRVLDRLSVALLPACYLALLGPLGWADLADCWAAGGYLAELLLALAPLLVGEALRIVVEVRGDVEPGDAGGARPVLRSRFAFVVMFTLPWVALALVGDLLQPHRAAFAFVIGTGIGLTLGTLAFVVVIGFLLPLVFRLALGLTPRLPEPVGTDLRATAAALGFRGSSLLLQDSGLRIANALLIGPMPWPRYLVLTDGLLAILDVRALRGVVAHEVGHAQAGHPAMLLAIFVAVPMLLANVGQQVPIELLASAWGIGGAALLALFAWWLLRRMSHRFEHEADVLSAIALGGAGPCIEALQRVGEVIDFEPDRATMLHPSQSSRIALLQRFAAEPAFRAQFALGGLRLRRAIAASLFVAITAGAWSWHRSWTWESASLAFHAGDFAQAQKQADAIGSDVPSGQWEWWQRFREELGAASAIAGDGGAFESLRSKLAEEGWQRGVATLLQQGPAAARPWIALSTEDDVRSPLRRSVLLYCEAAADADLDRMDEIASHVRMLGVPAELTPVFGG